MNKLVLYFVPENLRDFVKFMNYFQRTFSKEPTNLDLCYVDFNDLRSSLDYQRLFDINYKTGKTGSLLGLNVRTIGGDSSYLLG